MREPGDTPGAVMRPAYLGDARVGDHIRFHLPDPDTGGVHTFEGDVWLYERDEHAGFPMIRFRIGGDLGPEFHCRPDLHIDLRIELRRPARPAQQ